MPPPMPREMPSQPGGGGVFKQKPSGGDAPQDPRIPPGGFGGYNPYRDGNYMGGQGSIPLPSGGEMSQPGGGGVMIMNPDGSQRPYGTPAPGPGNELGSTGQRGMPKYDPIGMDELSQPGGGGVMIQQPGGGVQAYAKGGRVTAKPVAKKAVKAAAPAKTASRGDGIAQRGKTKGKMR